ncbi:MAG TPA: hypothetical protein VMV39_08620, partial [Terracidiphilus sp.]|nr:hypothetical protein [Terracidiphilus sp.]
MTTRWGKLLILLAALVAGAPFAQAQKLSRLDRQLAESILENVSSDIQKNYYDPKLHGLDWTALVRQTKMNIDDAPNWAAATAQIAGLLERLDDSHTSFSPPRNTVTFDYCWKFQIIGNRAYVTEVKPKSDAERKGMRPGDQVLTIEGFAVDRAGASNLEYALNVLMPRSSLQLQLLDSGGKILRLDVAAKAVKHPLVMGLGDNTMYVGERKIKGEDNWNKHRAKYKELGPQLMILRVPAFFELGSDVDDLFRAARHHKTLIVDLRGTPGGRVDSLL